MDFNGQRWPYWLQKISEEVSAQRAQVPAAVLKDPQLRVQRKMLRPNQRGLVVAHGVGQGKTLASIATAARLGMPTDIIVPAALQENYRKELMKWLGHVPDNFNIVSQQRVARGGIQSQGGLQIIDEGHRARSEGSTLMQELEKMPAKKRMILTGTPTFNHPRDIAPLVNLAAGKSILPTSQSAFEENFIETEKYNPGILAKMLGISAGERKKLKNVQQLKSALKNYVDYEAGQTKGFPTVTEEEVRVPMSSQQMDIYRTIMGKAPLWMRWKVKMGLPPGKGEIEKMRAFLTGARQVSNSTEPFVNKLITPSAPKIDRAFRDLQQGIKDDPAYKAVVYSNYLDAGLNPYKALLDKNKVPYGEFSGEISKKDRDQMVRDYNANKLRALLISSAGSEGLDLKATNLIQLLESHFNEEKEQQIIGRGVRYGSHAGLPANKRKVLVRRYLATPQAGLMDKLLGLSQVQGTDEYLRTLAKEKSLLNNQVKKLLAENQ